MYLSFIDFITQSLPLSISVFILMSLIIAYVGSKLTSVADRLADATGLGEALVGAVLLGVCTSLAGTVTSITAAYKGFADLAVSNGIGGIAAQTAFLGIADMFYRKANLEHGAASLANMMFATLLVIMLALILFTVNTPEVSYIGIHPISIILIVVYLFGVKIVRQAKNTPMWRPILTKQTVQDIPKSNTTKNSKDINKLWISFVFLGLIVAVAGFLVAQTGISIATKTGLSETFVGTFFTAVSTSLPELIVSISAVRQKALTLAVSNIIGGNCFDVLFLSFSDFAYREGSIYHNVTEQSVFVIVLAILMTGILSLGLLYREEKGPGKIGWESVLMIVTFVAGFFILL